MEPTTPRRFPEADEYRAEDYEAYEPNGDPVFAEPARQYDPIHPAAGLDLRRLAKAAWGVAVAIGLAALKFGALMIKFFGIFISVGAYALIWGWKFAVGFVLLILVHEAGHYFEARRQGLHPALPVFVPFMGAYVAIKDAPADPWRNALISIAGPVVGGLGALACWQVGEAMDSRLLVALAYTGFLLNLINLAPVPFLDGGFIFGAARALWRTPAVALGPTLTVAADTRARSLVVWTMYLGLAGLLVLGMIATHVPQDRL